jgi:hypothetical protein
MTFSYTQIALILMTIGSRFKSYIFASVLCIKEKEQTRKKIYTECLTMISKWENGDCFS